MSVCLCVAKQAWESLFEKMRLTLLARLTCSGVVPFSLCVSRLGVDVVTVTVVSCISCFLHAAKKAWELQLMLQIRFHYCENANAANMANNVAVSGCV